MKINIIYASTSGNVEFVSRMYAQKLEEHGHEVCIERAERAQTDVLFSCDLLILAASTWDHGVINPFFDKLHKYIKDNDMSGLKAHFLGLGDARYEPILFCGGTIQLRDDFVNSGGEEVGNMLMLNGDPYHQTKKVEMAIEKLLKTVSNE